MGSIFLPKELPLTEYPDERETLCIGVFGKEESFYTLKGLAETVAEALFVNFTYEPAQKTYLHPYQTASIHCNGQEVGYLGKVSYEIQDSEDMRTSAYILELDMEALSQWYGITPVFTPLPKFQEEMCIRDRLKDGETLQLKGNSPEFSGGSVKLLPENPENRLKVLSLTSCLLYTSIHFFVH